MFFSITVLTILSFSLAPFATGNNICTAGTTWRTELHFLEAKSDLFCTILSLYPCQDPFKCARRAIPKNMWADAGCPESDEIPRLDHFPECMSDHDCMMYTVLKYTRSLGKIDCNCDDVFNYNDRLAILLAKGPHCNGTGIIKPDHVDRFNICAYDKNVENISLQTMPCMATIIPDKLG